MEQELIFSNKSGALHKRPRLTKLTEARKKAGYKSQYEIAKDLGITQTEYCSYESGKKEMPKRIADKLSALLNMPVKEIKSVDYASVNLSDDAVKLLNKIFPDVGGIIPAIIFTKVDFPEPFFPIIASVSFRLSEKLTSFTA